MTQARGAAKPIASRRNALVARCRALAATSDDGWMLLDGWHLLDEASRAGIRIQTAAFTTRLLADPDSPTATLAMALASAGTRVVTASAPVMAAMSPAAQPSGIVAIAARPRAGLDAWLDEGPRQLVVACDIQEPGNVGAMIRVTHAAGAAGLIACGTTADPWNWKALRGSMGSTFQLPVFLERNTRAILEDLRHRGLHLVTTTPRGGESIYEVHLPEPLALLVGGEGAGLPDWVASLADVTVSLPMVAGVNSLNVSVATGITLYELVRRRSETP